MRKIREKGKKAKVEIYEFVCGYCGYKFEQRVRTFSGVTTQVQCPYCHNYLKSDSGK